MLLYECLDRQLLFWGIFPLETYRALCCFVSMAGGVLGGMGVLMTARKYVNPANADARADSEAIARNIVCTGSAGRGPLISCSVTGPGSALSRAASPGLTAGDRQRRRQRQSDRKGHT